MLDPEELINKILKLSWSDLEHERVKLDLGDLLEKAGFSITFEYKLRSRPRNYYIDLVAVDKKSGFRIGIEIDRATPKFKSVEKLRRLDPDLALMVLRSSQIPRYRIWQKVRNFPSNFVVLNLSKRCVIFANFIEGTRAHLLTRP